jgi:phosphoserine/homoserine phosphotransferase
MMKVCLDVEGVLIPEIWKAVAIATRIEELSITTRDEPDYGALMRRRISVLGKYGIRYKDICFAIDTLSPLPGAQEFLHSLRTKYQVALVSDSFYEFLRRFQDRLELPELYCHSLEVSDVGDILDWRPRIADQKPKCVKAFQALGFSIFAAGDSFNDLGMLSAADAAAFVFAPDAVAELRPAIPRCSSYKELEAMIASYFANLKGNP